MITSVCKSVLLFAAVVLTSLTPCAYGQIDPSAFGKEEEPSRDVDRMASRLPEIGVVESTDENPLAQNYLKSVDAWREASKKMMATTLNYQTDLTKSATEYLNEWADENSMANEKLSAVRRDAVALYRSGPEKYSAIGDLLYGMLVHSVDRDDIEGMVEVAQVLVENRYPGEEIFAAGSLAAIGNCEFKTLRYFWSEAESLGVQGPPTEEMESKIQLQEQKWKRELTFRAADAAADDLPRVEILTTKGRIVVELFEDQAPQTVANFIYLVENEYYNGLGFFRVLERYIAQVGCELNNGTGNPGYLIAGEGGRPNSRHHFRGTLAMALGNDPKTKKADVNSGGSQFYFTLFPAPELDQEYCVFGRVIEGLDVLGRIDRMNLSDENERKSGVVPDVIRDATVIRKRDHDYVPEIVSGQLLP
jgi:cyclophilin family peptidyl-prolyl cis-trans isomerase